LGAALAGRTVGLLGGLLAALSPYAVEFSQEAALYALAALLTTLALALGLRWQRSGRGGVAFLLVAVFAVYSHYVAAAIVLLFISGLALPYFRPESRVSPGRLLLAGAFAFLAWLPWLVPLALSWLAAEVPRSSLPQRVGMREVLGPLGQFTAGTAALLTGQDLLMLVGVICGAMLLSLAWIRSGAPALRAVRLILIIAVLLYLVPAFAAAVTGRWLFVPHFMVFLLPALLVVVAVGVVRTARSALSPSRGRVVSYAAFTAFVALLIAEVVGLGLFYAHPPHGADGLRELANELRAQARAGETVFVTPPALAPSLAQYFGGDIKGLPDDFDLRRIYLRYDGADWQRRSIARINAAARPGTRLWLVYRPERDEGGGLLSYLSSQYRLVSSTTHEFGVLYLFEAP
jgi:hypothetical protein